LVSFETRVLGETSQRFAGQFIQALAAPLELQKYLVAHAAGPVASNVIFDTRDGVFSRLSTEEIADVVCHLHQML
jgi:hypothetical protein